MSEKKQLPQFSRDAEVKAESFDESANTIDIVWTTGASVRRFSWLENEEYDEVLSLEPDAVRLERLNLGAPFLDTHCSYALENVIGSFVPGTARIEGGKGLATIKLSKAAGVADTVQKIREGVIRNVSVGYWIHKVIKTESDAGAVARWDVVDWEPLEASAVPIPADPGSQIRSETTAPDGTGPATRSCTFVTTKSPASVPKPQATKETRMATRKTAAKPGTAKRATKTATEIEAEKKRLAAARRDDDSKEGEDEDDKSVKDKVDEIHDEVVDDEENDADDEDKRDGDDADEENDADADEDDDKKDDERGVSAKSVRLAAENAVKADRARSSEIRAIAERAGMPKTGQRHIDKGTSVKRFKDLVLERMLDKQEKSTPVRGLSADEDVVRARGTGRSGGSEQRQIEDGAAHWRKIAPKAGKADRQAESKIA